MGKKKTAAQMLLTEFGRFTLLEITGKYYVTDHGCFRLRNPHVIRVEIEGKRASLAEAKAALDAASRRVETPDGDEQE